MVEIITIYIVISIISIIFSINLYKKFKILDKPNSRKIHISPTPLSGGFAFLLFISFFFVYYLMNFKELTTISFFFYFCILGLYVLGLLDDLYHLNAIKRIFFTSSIYLFFFSNDLFSPGDNFLLVNNLNLILNDIEINLNFIQSIIFTVFCLLCFQNAINMIDGLNGLSSLILIIINFFVFFFSKDSIFLEINRLLLVFLIVYFFFNIRGKLFFGESGIYIISFITSLLIIFGYKKGYFYVEQIILLLLIPGIDMIRVTMFRVVNKISISKPDKNHLHHKLLIKFDRFSSLLIVALLIIPTNLISLIIKDYTIFLILINILVYLSLITYLNKNYEIKSKF